MDGVGVLALQLHHHHEGEETIFFPALQEVGADAGLVGELDSGASADGGRPGCRDHGDDGPPPDSSADNASAARESMAAFGTIMTDHLDHEERDLEPFTAANFKGTPQAKAAQAAVRKSDEGPGRHVLRLAHRRRRILWRRR